MQYNIIGYCDHRIAVYTLMKILQNIGDVLVVTNDSHMLRLSDTFDSGGYYQNTMICYTPEGFDEFWQKFGYAKRDFNNIIIDGIIAPNADIYLYCKGRAETDDEKEISSFLEDYIPCSLYSTKAKYFDANTPYKIEEFEALRNMCTISTTFAKDLSKVLAPRMNIKADNIYKMAIANHTAAPKQSLLKRR